MTRGKANQRQTCCSSAEKTQRKKKHQVHYAWPALPASGTPLRWRESVGASKPTNGPRNRNMGATPRFPTPPAPRPRQNRAYNRLGGWRGRAQLPRHYGSEAAPGVARDGQLNGGRAAPYPSKAGSLCMPERLHTEGGQPRATRFPRAAAPPLLRPPQNLRRWDRSVHSLLHAP
jgi:hypothetical protein